MLFINKYEHTPLPKEFHYIHNICVLLYDQTVAGFKFEEYKSFGLQEIKSNKHVRNEFNSLNTFDDKINYLLKNGKNDDAYDLLTKKICIALIADFSHFVYEALSSAKKCKVTVALSLLRKPFTDELNILERLFLHPSEFIDNFYIEGDISKYDPSANEKARTLNKKELIENCVKKMKYSSFIFPQLIHDVRYDKNFKGAIQELTNKSIHIVTKDKHYQTESKDLNFIFNSVSSVKDYLHHIYTNTFYLLLYSSAIIDELYFRYLTNDNHEIIRKTKALIRFISVQLVEKHSQQHSRLDSINLLPTLFKNNKMECSSCGEKFSPTVSDLEYFFFNENIKCPNCLNHSIGSITELNRFVSRFDGILKIKAHGYDK